MKKLLSILVLGLLCSNISFAEMIQLKCKTKKISIPKKKTPLATEKNNIIIAMSETPTEEYQLDLSTEIEQFQEWLKNNKNGTYKEYLTDKTALLTEEQKKDPKIIDLEPYLPNFKDVIKQYEKEQEEKKETLEEFIYRRGNEMRLAEVNNAGVASLFKKRLKY